MFSKSLDSKKQYTLDDGTVAYDLSESIFAKNAGAPHVGSLFRVPSEYNMRPDLVSRAFYGTPEYTEMVLKYSLIDNPFTIMKDDVVYQASMGGIYDPVSDEITYSNDMSDFIKNRHKYIDKTKVPVSSGSQKTSTSIPDTPTEANISKTGSNGITISNGKIYFGDVQTDSSSPVDCATDGTTIGEFLNALTKNS